MQFSATTLLAVLALIAFVACFFPQVPEKYVGAVGGVLICIAVLVAAT